MEEEAQQGGVSCVVSLLVLLLVLLLFITRGYKREESKGLTFFYNNYFPLSRGTRSCICTFITGQACMDAEIRQSATPVVCCSSSSKASSVFSLKSSASLCI